MFTHANYRRKRISASLLHTMHKKAREKQAEYTLLIPSKMTRDIELYQKYGYQEAQPIAFLVPAKSPVELLNP
jgi:predicted acetyltransferase